MAEPLEEKRKKKEIADNIIKSLDVVKALGDVGKSSFDDPFVKIASVQAAWKMRFDAVIGLSDILRGIYKFQPDPENPHMVQLQHVGKGINELAETISTGFDDMKAYITEYTFFVKIVNPTLVLTKYMRDVYDFPGDFSVDNFKDAYKRNTPLTLAYNLLSYLEQDAINPVKKAMDAVKPRNMETFKKWRWIFTRLFGTFLCLENFARSVNKGKSDNSHNKLKEAGNEATEIISKLRNEYVKEDGGKYWDEMKKFMNEEWKHFNTKPNRVQADRIAKKLGSYFTDDAFYVCVFANGRYPYAYASFCSNPDVQKISKSIKDVVVYIYRSIKGDKWKQTDYDHVKNHVIYCQQKPLTHVGAKSFDDIIKQQVIGKGNGREDGFFLLVKKEKFFQIRSVNCPEHENGPGWYAELSIDTNIAFNKFEATLLVGLPYNRAV